VRDCPLISNDLLFLVIFLFSLLLILVAQNQLLVIISFFRVSRTYKCFPLFHWSLSLPSTDLALLATKADSKINISVNYTYKTTFLHEFIYYVMTINKECNSI